MEIDQATYLGFLLGQDLLLYDPAKRRRVLCSSSDLGGANGNGWACWLLDTKTATASSPQARE